VLRNSIYYWVFPYTFVVIILSLIPVPNLKIPEFDLFQPDKLVHFSMYFVMLFGWVKSKFFNESALKFKSLILVFVISFSTEILQGTSFIKRYFEIADLAANAIGILLSYGTFVLYPYKKSQS
jgi:glycopeptide antibiotics resistance protein